MCRALLYLGEPVLLDNLLFQPDSALVRQSYMPKMLHMLNLAGFGLRAWDRGSHEPDKPFYYGSTSLPVFDRNLKSLAEKVHASCVLAHVRGVAYSDAVEISLQNVHPFQFPGLPLGARAQRRARRFDEMKPRLVAAREPGARAPGPRHDRQRVDLRAHRVAARRPTRRRLARTPRSRRWTRALAHHSRGARRPGIDTVIVREPLRRPMGASSPRCATASTSAATRPTSREGARGQLELPVALVHGRARLSAARRRVEDDGGAERADSILVASEPLTRDIASWVEVPEYGVLHAEMRDGRPRVSVRLLD